MEQIRGQRPMSTADDNNRLYAYSLFEPTGVPIAAGLWTREWMDAMPERFPYRCLPMTIANQAGWMLHSPVGITAIWDGGMDPRGLRIDFGDAAKSAVPGAFQRELC